MDKDQIHDKVVEAQVIAKDTTAHVSAMLNQDNINSGELEKLQDRLEELTQVLRSMNEDDVAG